MRTRKALIAVAFLGSLFLCPGCSHFQLVDQDSGDGLFSSAATAGDGLLAQDSTEPVYMDFPDVLIPQQMKRSNSDCYLMNGSGRLMLSGRVDGESLAQFFLTTMPGLGWQVIQEYKYQGNIRHFYSKPGKIATILVAENPLDTKVEIWVTPLQPASGAVSARTMVQPSAAPEDFGDDSQVQPMGLPMQQ